MSDFVAGRVAGRVLRRVLRRDVCETVRDRPLADVLRLKMPRGARLQFLIAYGVLSHLNRMRFHNV